MNNDPAVKEPTVLVKLPDGTFVHRTLAEVRQSSQKKPASNLAPLTPKAPLAALRRGAPTAATAPPTPFTKEDAPSLLEETVPIVNEHFRLTSASRDDQVDAVMKKLSFQPAAEHTNRLRTVIQLRLKDVRSVDQTKEVLTRRALDGGVELTLSQAEEVLGVCKSFEPEPITPSRSARALSNDPVKKDETITTLGNQLPIVETRKLPPATATPNNSFVHAPVIETVPVPATAKIPVKPGVGQARAGTGDAATSAASPGAPRAEAMTGFKLSSVPRARTTMNDVVAKPVEMTAVDELRYFTLTDFRRLSNKPEEATMRLKQKFVNLKDESILFFLDALAAWQTSPLYLEYVARLTKSLADQKPLVNPDTDKDRITLAEMQSLARLNSSL